MQIFIILLTLSFSILLAQGYEARKIDMHGGKHNSLGGYQQGSFRSTSMGTSMFLDRNSTKNVKVKKDRSN